MTAFIGRITPPLLLAETNDHHGKVQKFVMREAMSKEFSLTENGTA
ncbi:hypothetical protein RR42_s0711 [Cupriavidus basilensis]|uniref:Uncharacterized protein n=1 Tax=Cupriavidus basilensis TaxID=68895 RepID=A0A0C4Y9Z9_9BURK|nr:hypothetical protein RR42_s0711 [Cupriavidus basilensis]